MRRLALLAAATGAAACGGLASALVATPAAPLAQGSTTASTAASTTVVNTAPTVLAVSGHGWGHGLGMSQWGAYGYAKHGFTYDRILAHYYPGTTLGATRVATIRILLASEKKVTLSSPVAWVATASDGTRTPLPLGDLKLGAALSINGVATQPPLTFAAKGPILVDGHAYRGRLRLSTDGRTVSVVDVVALETYLKGVVPSEMPSGWPPDALEAQAVAARSYALANRAKGRPFDLYGDTRSQAYGGVAAEAPSASAAVDATRGKVLTYAGKVADALYFSTSGGRTASALESTGIAVPYLVPVPDPYDVLSPYHDWGPVLFDAAAVAKQLKLAAPIEALRAVDGPSGRVKTVTVTTSDDAVASFSGNQLRATLDLRSTWFEPTLLQLLPAAKTVTYGGAATLTGIAPASLAPTLEAKPYGAGWAPTGALSPDGTGAFSVVVKPQVGTWYRVAAGAGRIGLAKVAVAARVSAVQSGSSVAGTARPAAAGAPVQLQEQGSDGAWATVDGATTDAAGTWRFPGPLASGTYRVRCAPGHGIAAGVSTAFVVS